MDKDLDGRVLLLTVYTIGVFIHGFFVFGVVVRERNSYTLSGSVITRSMYKACTAAKQSSTRNSPRGFGSHRGPAVRFRVSGGSGSVTFAGNASEMVRLRGEAEVRARRVRGKNIYILGFLGSSHAWKCCECCGTSDAASIACPKKPGPSLFIFLTAFRGRNLTCLCHTTCLTGCMRSVTDL